MFRAYARFGIVVFLALAILAAIGAARLVRSRSPGGARWAFALVAITLVELTPLPPFRSREVLPTSAHRWLARQTKPVRVMDCVPSASGAELTFFFEFAPEISVLGGIEDCGDPGFVTRLAQQSFSHLLIRRSSAFGRWFSARPVPDGLRAVGSFDDALLFEVGGLPAQQLLTSFSGGFHWREYKGERSYRWMSRSGTLIATNVTAETLSARLELELRAFAVPRRVEVSLDGDRVEEIEVGIESAVYSFGPFELAPGNHLIELRSRSPATVADEVLGNLDRRALTVALWELHWRFDDGPE